MYWYHFNEQIKLPSILVDWFQQFISAIYFWLIVLLLQRFIFLSVFNCIKNWKKFHFVTSSDLMISMKIKNYFRFLSGYHVFWLWSITFISIFFNSLKNETAWTTSFLPFFFFFLILTLYLLFGTVYVSAFWLVGFNT